MGPLFSPLDAELELLPGAFTPLLHERLVQVGHKVPSFDEGAEVFTAFTGAPVSSCTVRRYTERAGAVLEALETAAVVDHPPPLPSAPSGSLWVNVDGAMVHVRKEGWREVRTLAVGVVEPPRQVEEERVVSCRSISYFSRWADADTFGELATVEIQRRGVPAAGRVGVGADGALWCQKFYDRHCPQAVRILDFPHAAGYVHGFSKHLYSQSESLAQWWAGETLHALKHEGPDHLLNLLRCYTEVGDTAGCRKEAEAVARYFESREAQIQYPQFRAAGWPIGTGMVESANKVVMERRMKGPGMHWGANHVNPMLALRGATCSGRWGAAWAEISLQLREGRHPVATVHAKT